MIFFFFYGFYMIGILPPLSSLSSAEPTPMFNIGNTTHSCWYCKMATLLKIFILKKKIKN